MPSEGVGMVEVDGEKWSSRFTHKLEKKDI